MFLLLVLCIPFANANNAKPEIRLVKSVQVLQGRRKPTPPECCVGYNAVSLIDAVSLDNAGVDAAGIVKIRMLECNKLWKRCEVEEADLGRISEPTLVRRK